jgi:hypothetical protein
MYFASPAGLVSLRINMCSASQPSSRAITEAIRSAALLAEQGISAVPRSERPDLAGLGEVDDVLVVGIARPRVSVSPGASGAPTE